MLVKIGDILLVISALFVGDFILNQIPMFFIVWLFLIFYRGITKLNFSIIELKLQFSLLIILAPLLLNAVVSHDEYYYFLFQLILCVNIIPLILRIMNNKNSPVISCILLGVIVIAFNIFGSSKGFIFGPNILYRIFGFIFMLLLGTLFYSKDYTKFTLALIGFLFLFIGILGTGSRGGFLTLIICFLFLFIYLMRTESFRYIFVFSLVIIAALIVNNLDEIIMFLGRLVYFDLNNASESTRLDMYRKLFYFLEYGSSYNLLFGLGNLNYLYPDKNLYPHNLIIEVVVYHGLIYFIISLSAAVYLLYLCFFCRILRYFVAVFSPIGIGVMLSGNLTDNFVVFIALFAIPILKYEKIKM